MHHGAVSMPDRLAAKLEGLRQRSVLGGLARLVEESPNYEAAILLGSFAAGTADHLSDLDLLLVVQDGRFEKAWEERIALHVTDAIVAWDVGDPTEGNLAAHKWLTSDLVLVECLIATAQSGVRLAEPHVVIAGLPQAVERVEGRPPISRDEFTGAVHPVEQAYDRLKGAVRLISSDLQTDRST